MALRRIVVPLDGSAQAEHALLPAADLAQRAKAALVLAHADTLENYVYVEGLPVLGTQGQVIPATASGSHEQVYLSNIADRLRASHHIPVTTAVLSESGASAAHMLAHFVGDDPDTLVVMTTHGRGGLERLWMGSVAEQLLRQAETPLLLLKPSAFADVSTVPEAHIRRVLVPLDGSLAAEQILPAALGLAELYNASLALLRVVHVYEQTVLMPFAAPYLNFDDTFQQRQAQADAYLSGIADRLRTRTTAITTQVAIASHVAQSIVVAANAVPGTLIAMTTHARGSLDRVLIGSVADKVLRAANEPVLMQKPVTAR